MWSDAGDSTYDYRNMATSARAGAAHPHKHARSGKRGRWRGKSGRLAFSVVACFDDMDWLYFTLGSLVAFRLSLLVSKESGPAFIFRKLRRLPEKGSATKEGLGCQWCTSIYSSALVTTFFYWCEKVSGRDWVLYWLAFSAAAIVANQTFIADKKGK